MSPFLLTFSLEVNLAESVGPTRACNLIERTINIHSDLRVSLWLQCILWVGGVASRHLTYTTNTQGWLHALCWQNQIKANLSQYQMSVKSQKKGTFGLKHWLFFPLIFVAYQVGPTSLCNLIEQSIDIGTMLLWNNMRIVVILTLWRCLPSPN